MTKTIPTTRAAGTATESYNTSLPREKGLSTERLHNKTTGMIEKISDVIFTTPISVGSVFKAQVSYLNLSKLKGLDGDAALLEHLKDVKIGDTISFQVVSKESARGSEQPTMQCAILDTESSGGTLIKTPFGLISSDIDLHRNIGAEIFLSINTLSETTHGSRLSYAAERGVELVSMALRHSQELEPIVRLLLPTNDMTAYRVLAKSLLPHTNPTTSRRVLSQSRRVSAEQVENWIEEEIVNPMLDAEGHNIVRQLEALVRNVRESTEDHGADKNNNQQWHTILIPIFDGNSIKQCKLFVRGSGMHEHFTRFIVDIDVSYTKLQVDGLVHFTKHGSGVNHIDRLELTLKMQTPLKPSAMSTISKIFLAHQRITGIKGMIKFEEVETLQPSTVAVEHPSLPEESTILCQDA
jgi:hypothetical protein